MYNALIPGYLSCTWFDMQPLLLACMRFDGPHDCQRWVDE